MTNHPNRNRKPNLLLVEDGYAYITLVDESCTREISTCKLHDGRYIRVDDGKQYPQLCAGGSRRGATLSYGVSSWSRHSADEQLARDCNARLFKTRERYEAARDRLMGE